MKNILNIIQKPAKLILLLLSIFYLISCTNKSILGKLEQPEENIPSCEISDSNELMLGEGTTDSPFLVCEAEHIPLIGSSERYSLSHHYIMEKDIDMGGMVFGSQNGERNLVGGPCDQGAGFSGVLNGKGHRVYNYFLSSSLEYLPQEGMFACLTQPRNDSLKDVIFVPARVDFCDIVDPQVMRARASTMGTPYILCSAQHVIQALNHPDRLNQNYALYADIDLGGAAINLLGSDNNGAQDGCGGMGFQGVFDARDLSITNFKIADSITEISNSSQSIFGCIENTDRMQGDSRLSAVRETPTQICPDLLVRPSTPMIYTATDGNPRIICNASELSESTAYIQTEQGRSQNYVLGRNIDLAGASIRLIGRDSNGASSGCNNTGFSGNFDAARFGINNFKIADSVTEISNSSRSIFGCIESTGAIQRDLNILSTRSATELICADMPERASNPIIYTAIQGSPTLRLICNPGEISENTAYIRTVGLNGSYMLGRNITFSGNFTPINNFTGDFDGNKKKLTNLSITSSAINIGFFSELSSDTNIGNLVFENAAVNLDDSTSSQNGGILAGRISSASVVVDRIWVSGGSVSNAGGGADNMGGLIGLQSNGTIRNCMASSNISVGGGNGDNMGGLVGQQDNGMIQNSITSGNVSDSGPDTGGSFNAMGGLVGRQNNGTIERSMASGNISNGSVGRDYMGGLLGRQDGTIRNSIASGDITNGGFGANAMGGLVGFDEGTFSSRIQNSISLGSATMGSGDMGGFRGICDRSPTSSYWDTDTSARTNAFGSGTCTGVTGRTTTQIQQNNPTLTNITAANGWNHGTNTQYPGLSLIINTETCTLRHVAIAGGSTRFAICPDASGTNSLHPACRVRPANCP